MSSANSLLLWSAIVCGSSLVVVGLLIATLVHLWFSRLLSVLSNLNRTLQLCASALLRTAGDNLTEASSEVERLQSRTVGTADRT